jgi:uncharacterized protein (DUF1697 family)
MPKYIAFLRAINVGGHTVKMDQLRDLFAGAGLTNVETFIASGNVIFDSTAKSQKALEQKIEKHLKASLGYEVATFIRAATELAAIADYKPFNEAEFQEPVRGLYIAFLAAPPSGEAQKKLLSCASKVDDFHIHGSEVYWLIRANFSDSEFSGARLEKTLGMRATVRNTTTVKKLAAKYS